MAALDFPLNPSAYETTPWVDSNGLSWLYDPAKNRWGRAEAPIKPENIGAASEEFAIAMAVAL